MHDGIGFVVDACLDILLDSPRLSTSTLHILSDSQSSTLPMWLYEACNVLSGNSEAPGVETAEAASSPHSADPAGLRRKKMAYVYELSVGEHRIAQFEHHCH